MAISKDFMEAVQTGKKIRVRIMLKDNLLVDPTGAQFDEMSEYAEKRIEDLYDEHDGEDLNFDVSAWNEDYLNQQMVTVVNCFSRERIKLLKSMVRFLYKEKADKIHSEEKNATDNTGDSQNNITRRQIGVGVTVAGGALAVAGVCTAHTALTIGGVVVAAAGVALIVSDKGNES